MDMQIKEITSLCKHYKYVEYFKKTTWRKSVHWNIFFLNLGEYAKITETGIPIVKGRDLSANWVLKPIQTAYRALK